MQNTDTDQFITVGRRIRTIRLLCQRVHLLRLLVIVGSSEWYQRPGGGEREKATQISTFPIEVDLTKEDCRTSFLWKCSTKATEKYMYHLYPLSSISLIVISSIYFLAVVHITKPEQK